MPHVTVPITGGEASVHYDVAGHGPGVVLVHGTGASGEQWQPLTELLRDRFTVVVPDYSGSGRTRDHGGPVTLADLAAEVTAAAGHAGLESFHLVGHSLGAAVATHIAGTRPALVRSLVLHAGWAHTDARMDAEFRLWLHLLRTDPALFARSIALSALGPRFWAQTTAEASEALVTGLAATLAPGTDRQTEVDRTVDLRPLLGRVTAPTLVLASAHDRIIAPAQQRALVAGIAGARYAEVDAGHGAHAENPGEFFGTITAFLDDQLSAADAA
ncbi:alpha/beta hydrolase [Amycolatopsis deserti]|uniref:Alpha/beta hydrolase n=1 Tax=Amycolatopsis deserti TaxID=185696 RepID=A0ABQ3J5C2_9PSEU|nr:alpha/beta fold hydrolase [Amycolatopsis deserti]GHF04028.1 alpha/beta hydrolase [Amycolatopsis deserti]